MSIRRRLQRMERLARITARCSCAPGDGVDVEFAYRRDPNGSDAPTDAPRPRACPRCRKQRRLMSVAFVYERRAFPHEHHIASSKPGRETRGTWPDRYVRAQEA